MFTLIHTTKIMCFYGGVTFVVPSQIKANITNIIKINNVNTLKLTNTFHKEIEDGALKE